MKTKYDWWGAMWHIVSYNFAGFVAFVILVIFLLAMGLTAFTFLVKSFGFLGAAVLAAVISIVIIAGLTYREIKKRGYRYAKY